MGRAVDFFGGPMFITLYTDASYKPLQKKAQIAWKGKCELGEISSAQVIDSHDVHHAEMMAILFGIADAMECFPALEGFFINSDNLACVQTFWTFKRYRCPKSARGAFREINLITQGRWIRAKHVKAHTKGQDIRSYMNKTVDKMTKRRINNGGTK